METIFNPPKDSVCSKQPIGVTKSCTFIVNVGKLDHRNDIRSDDLGVWKNDGIKIIIVVSLLIRMVSYTEL